MGRLRGDRGAAHPVQGHLSQERRDAFPSLRGQQGPDRRRQNAHRGIQANAPGRTALQTRFSAIRRCSSIYERCREWDIERFFNKLKHFRAIATRYDKLAKIFLAGVQLACAAILLN
jgi:transposase